MRISDWSSDVCSSDLLVDRPVLETTHFLLGQQLRRGIAHHAQGRPHDAEVPQRLERAQRIGVEFALIIDAAHPRPLDEIVGQNLVPQLDDFAALRKEAMPTDVEAKALMRSEEHTSELQPLM